MGFLKRLSHQIKIGPRLSRGQRVGRMAGKNRDDGGERRRERGPQRSCRDQAEFESDLDHLRNAIPWTRPKSCTEETFFADIPVNAFSAHGPLFRRPAISESVAGAVARDLRRARRSGAFERRSSKPFGLRLKRANRLPGEESPGRFPCAGFGLCREGGHSYVLDTGARRAFFERFRPLCLKGIGIDIYFV